MRISDTHWSRPRGVPPPRIETSWYDFLIPVSRATIVEVANAIAAQDAEIENLRMILLDVGLEDDLVHAALHHRWAVRREYRDASA